jgi:F0F1-type ATP synthase delta subunit
MNKVSRRSLAQWAVDQLISGRPAATVAKHLAAVLMQSGMTHQVGFLIDDIAWELEQRQALAVSRVTSARALSKQVEKTLIGHIKQATGARDVVLEKNVDKSVIGGLRVETSNHVWDSTIVRKLAELKEVF